MTVILQETTTAAPVKRGQKFLVTIGTAGQGSSGNYSSEVWERYGPTAFPAGTRAYWKHGNPEDRDPRDRVGHYTETFWNSEEQKFQGYLQPKRQWVPVLEEMIEDGDGDVSIQCGGVKDEEGNILELHYSRNNSVDFVGTNGLVGARLEALVESARGFAEEPGAKSAQEKEEAEMQEVLDAIKAQNTILTELLGKFDAKAKDEAQVVADAAAAEAAAIAAVEAYSANIAAVEAARKSLLEPQVEALLESAKGLDKDAFTAAVDNAKKVAEAAKSAVLTESATGRDFGANVKDAAELGKVL